MGRIYVTDPGSDPDTYGPGPAEPCIAGYFLEEKATYWGGAKDFRTDVNTREEHHGQGLYLTAKGRWVLRSWSNWQGESDSHAYVSERFAKNWLIFNGYDAVAEEHFGDIEEERGPGRPEVGNLVGVRLGDLQDPVDAYAEQRGWKRAETVRHLVKVGLKAESGNVGITVAEEPKTV